MRDKLEKALHKSKDILSKILKTPQKQTLEQQFLPAVLEITDTPPSPLGRVIAYAIMAVFTVVILLACFTKVDIIAVAPGKIISSGKIKLIQPLKSGVVFDIYVRDGQFVHKDDPLVKVKFEDSESNRTRLEQELMFASIDVARYASLLEADPLAAFLLPPGTPKEVELKNRKLLLNDIEKMKVQERLIDDQVFQAKAERSVVEAEIKKVERAIPLIQERLEAKETLYNQQLVAKTQFLELKQQVFEYEETRQINKKRLEEVDAKLKILKTQKGQVRINFDNEVMYKLQEAFNKEEILRKELENAVWLEGLTEIKAPEDGIIQEMEIHTVGGIVTPAQTLMKLAPYNSMLEAEVTILNKDIGFVREGQEATVKIDSFPYTKYGTIDGKILHISKDAMENKDLGLVYNARISLATDTIKVEEKDIRLSAGMTVVTEVKTGKRRVIEYILAPFVRYKSESLRER